MGRGSIVEEVADRIAFQIASGAIEAGQSLPSIRRLAEEHAINPATVQQVLGRLRTAGFVEPRQGVGVVVCDVQLQGGIETWRYMFRFSRRLPEFAATTVREILETLRMYYRSQLEKVIADPAAYDPGPTARAVRRLELLAGSGHATPADVHTSVVNILRTSYAAFGGGVGLGMLNSLSAMIGDVPEAVDALYCAPAEHAWFWRQVLTAWETGDAELGHQTLAVLDDWHAEAITRLRTRLTAQPLAPALVPSSTTT